MNKNKNCLTIHKPLFDSDSLKGLLISYLIENPRWPNFDASKIKPKILFSATSAIFQPRDGCNGLGIVLCAHTGSIHLFTFILEQLNGDLEFQRGCTPDNIFF